MELDFTEECTIYVDGVKTANNWGIIIVPAGAQVLAVETDLWHHYGQVTPPNKWMYSSVYQGGWNGIYFTAEPPFWQPYAYSSYSKLQTPSAKLFYFRTVLGTT